MFAFYQFQEVEVSQFLDTRGYLVSVPQADVEIRELCIVLISAKSNISVRLIPTYLKAYPIVLNKYMGWIGLGCESY